MFSPHTHKAVGIRPDGLNTVSLVLTDRGGNTTKRSIQTSCKTTPLIRQCKNPPGIKLINDCWDFSECLIPNSEDADQWRGRVLRVVIDHYIEALSRDLNPPHIRDYLGEPFSRQQHPFSPGRNWLHGVSGIRPAFIWRQLGENRMLATVLLSSNPDDAILVETSGEYLWLG